MEWSIPDGPFDAASDIVGRLRRDRKRLDDGVWIWIWEVLIAMRVAILSDRACEHGGLSEQKDASSGSSVVPTDLS